MGSYSASSQALLGKVCLVTGATSGIGKITATALAAQGATVVVVGRNGPKSQGVVRDMRAETGNDAVDVLLADFADLQQVRELAAAFKEKHSQLDVLVNNAGAFFNTRTETAYGVEMTFLVNHLAPFLLTSLLLEPLLDSAPARVVNLSSNAHKYGRMDFDDLNLKHSYSGMNAYSRSKLANLLCTYELARRLADRGVSVNAVHPGHVATDLWRTQFPIIGPVVKWFMGLFALSPEQGADNTIYLASSPEVEGISGKYFVKREPAQSSAASYDEDLAQRLWELSESITSLTRPKSK